MCVCALPVQCAFFQRAQNHRKRWCWVSWQAGFSILRLEYIPHQYFERVRIFLQESAFPCSPIRACSKTGTVTYFACNSFTRSIEIWKVLTGASSGVAGRKISNQWQHITHYQQRVAALLVVGFRVVFLVAPWTCAWGCCCRERDVANTPQKNGGGVKPGFVVSLEWHSINHKMYLTKKQRQKKQAQLITHLWGRFLAKLHVMLLNSFFWRSVLEELLKHCDCGGSAAACVLYFCSLYLSKQWILCSSLL